MIPVQNILIGATHGFEGGQKLVAYTPGVLNKRKG